MLFVKQLLLAAGLASLASANPLSVSEECRVCPHLINECGAAYGHCYNFCNRPKRKFRIPECNGVHGKKQVCEFSLNECNKLMGGCYPEEGPIPQFANPGCP